MPPFWLSTVLLLTAGCGGSTKSSSPDAAAVMAKLKAGGLPVANIAVVTAADDPNQMLGRPSMYVSKDTFTDTRIDPSKARDNSAGAVDLGGSVEVFSLSAVAQDLQQRLDAVDHQPSPPPNPAYPAHDKRAWER